MPGFGRLTALNRAYDDGQSWYSTWRKVPSSVTVAGNWFDLSMAPGNPRANFYTGGELEAEAMFGVDTLGVARGMVHGPPVAPARKFLHKLGVGSVTAGVGAAQFTICDYLLFYSLIDMDAAGPQTLIQTETLPRYADGVGVQAFVVATNPYVGGAPFQLTYRDQDNALQTSPVLTSSVNTNISSIIHASTSVGAAGPFVPYFAGQTGIRSVETIEFFSPNGGLATLVLCKPLATVGLREITAYSETDFLSEIGTMPVIEDNAFLGMLCKPSGSALSAPIYGELHTVWN